MSCKGSSNIRENVWKDLCLNPVSAKDEFDRLLAKVIKISTTESKVRSSIRHNTKDVSIEAGTFGNDRECGCTKGSEPLLELLERSRLAFAK